MDSPTNELAFELPSVFRLYKDGRIDRLTGTEHVPPGLDPNTNVESKDITIKHDNTVSARIFRPKDTTSPHGSKLPLLIYVHGGAFCVCSPFTPLYTAHLNAITASANVIAVSVHYRTAPEYALPVAYEDTWDAVKWVALHAGGDGPEQWLNDHANLDRVFLAGDSAGANLAHYAAVRAGVEKLEGLKLEGLVAVHPFFMKDEPDKLIELIFPSGKGNQDPRMNPGVDRDVKSLGCKRVLIFIAEKDILRDRGVWYFDVLKKSGWDGEVEIVESEGEDHCFHLFKPNCDKAVDAVNRFVQLIKYG